MILNLDTAKTASAEIQRIAAKDPMDLYRQLQHEKTSLSDFLENLDPTERDENGKPLTVDALQRYLMVNEVRLSGPRAITLQKLMESSSIAVLPELVRREVMSGMTMNANTDYSDLVATVVPNDGATYHPLYIPGLDIDTVVTRRQKSLAKRASIDKGGEFAVTTLRYRDKDIVLGDYGRQIEAPYSYLSGKSWPEIAVFLKLIGAQIAIDMIYDIYFVCLFGDGTTGAPTNVFNGAPGVLAYSDLTHAFTSFTSPFTMNRMICPVAIEETILQMAQFQDPLAGWEFQKTGKPVTPMGSKIVRVQTTPGGAPAVNTMIVLDKNFAVRQVTNGELMVEAEKIISRRFEKAVVSQECSFCNIANGAVKQITF
jgi:hypothetical protein